MPSGYLVSLGDGILDAGDAISGGWTTFTTSQVLGAGQWQWTGTWSGQSYTNELEPGVYYLATNGNTYFVPDFGQVDTITAASVVSAPADGIVSGTTGADVIDLDFVDTHGESIDDGTGGPADSVVAGDGDDTAYGGMGSDTLDGGSGNDVLYGDYGDIPVSNISETMQWSSVGPNNTNVAAGFTENTGNIDVTFSFSNDGNNNPTFEVDTDYAQYVAPGETYSNTYALFLYGQGDGATSTTTIDFAAASGASVEDEVQNLAFRINDIDWGANNHTDIITVNAYDANGDPVTVTLTPSGGDTVSGNTITAEAVADDPDTAGGSVLVEIAGPVSQVEIIYGNLQSNTQGVWVTDLQYEAVPMAQGDDSLVGGTGEDTLFGEAGNDTLEGGDGADSLDGGTGNDSLDGGTGSDTLAGGDGADTLIGGTGMDYADYSASDAAVTVDLATNTFSGGHATGDTNGGGMDGIIGSDFNDSLTGYDVDGTDAEGFWTNVIDGGLGDDTIYGLGGADSLYGGDGADSVDGGDGADYISGGLGNDTLLGGLGDDTIDAGGNADSIVAGDGNDSVLGGWGDDTVDAGAGDDTVIGGNGRDWLSGGTGNDSLSGDALADTLFGGDGSDTLDGGTGDDVLSGDLGADSLVGGDGNDTIFAAAGDTVNGGDGDDVITLVDLGEAPGSITIEGLTTGQTGGDVLDFNGLVDRSTINITDNTGGELTGTATMFDGTTVSFSNIDAIICFTPGTRLLTATGYRRIETLRPGDMLVTRDAGLQPIRWMGSRTVAATGNFAPMRIEARTFGGKRDLLVSPQHRMLIENYRAELLFGSREVLVAATHLDGLGATRQEGGEVTYIHVMLDAHQVIYADGMATESFHPGQMGLSALTPASRDEMFGLFPHLRGDPALYGDTARLCLKRHEAASLLTFGADRHAA